MVSKLVNIIHWGDLNGSYLPGDQCLISGWGDIDKFSPGIQAPDTILQVAEITLKDFGQCKNAYQRVKKVLNPQRHLCASGDGVDTCQGDSGGPLVCFRVSFGG